MEHQYLDRLSPDIRTLVNEVEQSSGIEIEVKVDPSRARGVPDQPDPLACEVNQYGAQVLLPKADYFPDGSVLHELLHIQRFLSHGIPRIVAHDDFDGWTPDLDAELISLDNNLEHLIIVPEELRRRPPRRAHWERILGRVFDELPSLRLSEGDRLRQALINWAFICHVLPESRVIERARAVIQGFGLQDRAQRYVDVIVQSLDSKEKVVAVAFQHLQLRLESASLEYLDSRTGRSHEIPLAKTSE
jgi:hypothetical protein